jgi:two-component system sensor histidine kinase QseC
MTARGIEPLADPSEPEMQLFVARDRKPLDRALMLVVFGLVVCEALIGSATVWLLRYQLRESLQPLNDVAKLAASVDATSLHQRFPVETMPRELQPICQRLNDLLARIAKAVESQKRFNADAAHELRTPVAEVRALAEVALRWPEDADATRKAFEEIVSVTQHMERLSSVLLQLSGADGRVSTREEAVDLSKTLTQAIERQKDVIVAKNISLTVDLPATQPVTSDATLLTAIVENLIDNAITYTPAGGTLSCSTRDANSFQIVNGPTNLSAADLATMSEPFWRKDPSRTGGKMGLGLALTRAYLSTLHGSLSLSLDGSSRLTASVVLHADEKA